MIKSLNERSRTTEKTIKEQIKAGKLGVHLWKKLIKGSEIKESDRDNYYISVDNLFIREGLLNSSEVYKVKFTLAKLECPLFSYPLTQVQEHQLRFGFI